MTTLVASERESVVVCESVCSAFVYIQSLIHLLCLFISDYFVCIAYCLVAHFVVIWLINFAAKQISTYIQIFYIIKCMQVPVLVFS